MPGPLAHTDDQEVCSENNCSCPGRETSLLPAADGYPDLLAFTVEWGAVSRVTHVASLRIQVICAD